MNGCEYYTATGHWQRQSRDCRVLFWPRLHLAFAVGFIYATGQKLRYAIYLGGSAIVSCGGEPQYGPKGVDVAFNGLRWRTE